MTIQNSNSISVNQPNLKGLSSLVLGLIVLSGCAVGPNYHQPNVTAPAHWGEPMTGGETNSSSSVAAWWKNFNDPELDSLIERAVKSNLDLTISAARVREARAQYRVTSADLWPTVGTSASYERQLQSKNQPIIGALPLPASVPFENNVYQAGFDASWEIDVFGGKRRATEAAKAEVAAAEFGRRDTLVTLLGEAARNYVEARGYQRQLTIARQNITAQEEDLAITQDRFKHGLSSDLDVQQAATLLATTRSQIPTLEMNLQTSIHRLGVLLAQPPGALLEELSTVAPIPAAPPEVPVGLPSELLLRRPDVQKAERQLAAATAQIGVATADLFPKFSLTGAVGYESVSASDWFAGASKFWSLGPTVQWNIFDAGRIRANIKVQNARQEQALANYEQTVLVSFEDVENALVGYAKEQVRRRSLEDAVKSSQESLRLANQLYANGLANFINVLDAERSLYQAQDQLVQSERAVSTNLISLYKALGGGWENAEREAAFSSAQAK
jgi:NodT family efflux transporter outer membrane factor (OMF) lipoprotein